MSQGRIAELHKWRQDNGDFVNFEQVLQLKGFGAKTLEKCCTNVLITHDPPKQANAKRDYFVKLRIKPRLNVSKMKSIESYVSVHVDTNALTWARFEVMMNETDIKDEFDVTRVKVTHWSYYKLLAEKAHIYDLHRELSKFIEEIPESDVYIHEDLPGKPHRANIGPKQMTEIVQAGHSIAILITLLASRTTYDDENFYFLGRLLMAR